MLTKSELNSIERMEGIINNEISHEDFMTIKRKQQNDVKLKKEY